MAIAGALATALIGGEARALVVEGGATVNTTSAGFNSVFYNVGDISNGTLVYLGDGWALTAGHVFLPGPVGEYTGFNTPSGGEGMLVENTIRLQSVAFPGGSGSADLQLVRLSSAPTLPSIFQNIATASPTAGSVVAMVGGGDDNGSPLYWNNATADSTGAVNLGSSSSAPAGGTPTPIPSDTYWFSQNSTVAQGTYQDAGFSWGGRGAIQWGESVVTVNNLEISNPPYNSNTFATTFYNSTYDPPTNSAWAASVAAIGSNMASVASGDSGGAVFIQSGSGWSLVGSMGYAFQYSRNPLSNSIYPSTAYGDLSADVDLSTYRSAILSVIYSTLTWTGSGNTWDTTSTNWANAGQNASTAFIATANTANAMFGNTNSLFNIPLNSPLQTIAIQQSGISAASITFTNTGAANGGADYSIGGGAIGGTPIYTVAGGSPNNSIVLSGNGNGLGGTVYLTGANSFTGGVLVEAGHLNLQNGLALGNSSGVFVNAGADLELQNSSGNPITFGLNQSSAAIQLDLNGSGFGGAGALENILGLNTFAGSVYVGTSSTIGSFSPVAGDKLTLTGSINLAGSTLTITGPGNTVVSGSGVIGTGILVKSGSGTLTFDFAPGASLLSTTTALAVGGGSLIFNGASGAGTSQTIASFSVNSGASEIMVNSNGAVSNLTITSPTLARSVGGTVDFTLPASGGIGFASAPSQTNGILGGWATVGGSSWATLNGTNLTDYSGATPVSSAATLANGTNYDITASLAASGAANSLRFQNTATPAIVTLSGTVPITTGGILVPSTVTSAGTIAGGTLQGAASADLVVIQNSASALTISSSIADNGGATGLTKSGTGALTLMPLAVAPNTYMGLTTLNAGTLNINASAALGGSTLVINGGTIDNTSGTTITTTNAETWSGSFAFQGTNALSQSTGGISLTTNPTITINSPTHPLTIGGSIANSAGGNFGLTLAGSGTLVLSGANSFTGGVMINGGTLRIGGSGALNASAPNVVSFGSTSTGTLNLNGNSIAIGGLSSASSGATVEAAAASGSTTLTTNGIGDYTFAGAITNGGAGALALAKSGTGTQILSGLNSYTGGTTINAGVLQFNADADLPTSSAGTIVNSGGTLAAGSAIDQPFLASALISSGSTGTVALAANSSNNLDFSSAGANLPKVSLGSTGSYTYSGTLTPSGTNYNLGGGGGLLTFNGPLSGPNSLTVLNGGYVAPTAANSYSGGTTIDSGTTLLVSADTAATGIGSTAQLGQVPSSATTNITINGGTLEATSSFTLNANRGISLGSAGGTIDVYGITSSSTTTNPIPNTFTYGGVIVDSPGSAGGLTLTDTGTLVLSGANSYSGATNINSGTLQAGALNTIPQTSAVVLGLGGTLVLNGFSQSIGSLSGGGVVTNNSSTPVTLTVGNDNTSPAAFYGVISDTTGTGTGTLTLNKVGTGTLTLTGLNTYTGGMTVGGGTFIVAAPPSLAANSKLTVNAGTLEFDLTSGAATVQSGVTATVAAGATLQLAGSLSALSDGSALNPADGQLVNITNNGSTASGGGLLVTGTNQSVGTVIGTITSSPGNPTTYGGDTVVGPGGSLTATQILQNTLTIGAGATVTLRPASSGATNTVDAIQATESAADTSAQIQSIQNRIALLEQIEASEISSTTASALDSASPALLASTAGAANPAVADSAGASSTSDISTTLLASEITALTNAEDALLASEQTAAPNGGALGADGVLPAGSPAGPAVPEPSSLFLALIAVGLAALWCGRPRLHCAGGDACTTNSSRRGRLHHKPQIHKFPP